MNSDKLKDNDYIIDLNMDSSTKEQKIAWLNQIIENELEKPEDKIDIDLINECIKFIKDLDDEACKLNGEQISDNLVKLKIEVTQEAKKKSRRSVLKFSAILAAVFIISLSTVSIAAYATGYDNAWDFVSHSIEQLFGMEPGLSDIICITIINGTESKSYKNLEELLEYENLDIMYPAWLPDGVTITKVWQTTISDNNWILSFYCTDGQLKISIENNYSTNIEQTTDVIIYENNNFLYYILETNEKTYQAVCHFEGYEYIIEYSNYDNLIIILNNMKGLLK